jgi:DNA polymerase III delta subunit
MITWLVGENSFEVSAALRAIEVSFGEASERFDGTELALRQLPDLLMGVSLFSTKRLVVISDISKNASLWEKLPDWLGRINDDIHVVFIDEKPDKRTTSYKALKAASDVHEFAAWSERDDAKAEAWLASRAKDQSVAIDSKSIRHLVSRVGLDQWQLASALDTLSLLDEVSPRVIDDVIPPNLHENIFQLFEVALEGKSRQVAEMIKTLSLQEDPYALFALLTSQANTLVAVAYAEPSDTPTKDFAIHPFVASKLTRHAKKLGKSHVAHIIEAFAKADADMKRSRAAPWLLIQQLLLTIAR